MRNRWLTLSIVLLCGIAVAQTTWPGTFNNPPAQNTQQIITIGGYLVSTPTLSLGNGLTPTVITNQDTVNVSMPQNTSFSGPSVQVTNPATLNESAVVVPAPNATANVGSEQRVQGQASRNFDFTSAPDGGGGPLVGSMADNTISLGEVARKARNGKQIAMHSITNADVNALNGTNPDEEQTPTDGTSMATPQQPNTNGNAVSGASQGNSGATQPPSVKTKPNAEHGAGTSPRGNPTPVPPAQNDQDKPKLPKSSTSLPLVGTVGALSTLTGVAFFKTR